MPGVNIHGHVGEVELLERVVDALVVGILGLGALCNAQIGDHVGQAVGLDDKDGADVAVRLELGHDAVDVRLVVGHAVVGNSVLAVGRRCRAVTVGQVVDDEQAGVGRRSAGLVEGANVTEGFGHQGRDLGGSVTMFKDVSGSHQKRKKKRKRNRKGKEDVQPLESGHLGNRGRSGGH